MDALTKELNEIEHENLENKVLNERVRERMREAENDEIALEIKAECGQDLKN